MDERAQLRGRVRGAGLELAWREWPGAGLPVVLLHGVTGSSADWRAVATRLVGRRVIALDARGHGESDWDPAEEYTVDAHFADLSAALDEFRIERCVVAGFSMGGGTAIVAAACLPDLVAGLVVVDAYPYPEQTPGSQQIARWVAERAHETRRFDPAIARRFRELMELGVATRADLRSMWKAVECPAVVVRGAESRVLPAETAAAMGEDLAHARVVTIRGVSHGIPHARPAELADELAGFVTETETGLSA